MLFSDLQKAWKKSWWNPPEFVRILQSVPRTATSVIFNLRDFSQDKTRTIVQGLQALHERVKLLDFICDPFAGKNGDESMQIVRALPKNISTLTLRESPENKSNDELVQIYAALPHHLAWLVINRGTTLNKESTEIIRIFTAFPRRLYGLSLSQIDFRDKSDTDLAQIFAALPKELAVLSLSQLMLPRASQNPLQSLPENLSALQLSLCYLGYMQPETVARMFATLPASLTTCSLSANHFDRYSVDELVAVLSSLPSGLTTLDLTGNGIEKRPSSERTQIDAAIPQNVAVLYVEHNMLPVRLHETRPQPRTPAGKEFQYTPPLSAQEAKLPLSFLISLERMERALWQRNRELFEEEAGNFVTNLDNAGISTPTLAEMRVNYFMALAIRKLALCNNYNPKHVYFSKRPPHGHKIITEDTPMVIRGNPLESRYLWTALVLLASLLTDKKIDYKFIENRSADFNPKQEFGKTSLFSPQSLYYTEFLPYLNAKIIQDYLTQSSPKLAVEKQAIEHYEALLAARQSQMDKLDGQQRDIPETAREKITAIRLCQLAFKGDVREIQKYDFSGDEITQLVRHAIGGLFANYAGVYNALMVAIAYRHTAVITYFIEKKNADCLIKGGRRGDLTLLDCAKWDAWFKAVDPTLIHYLEQAVAKSRQIQLARTLVASTPDERVSGSASSCVEAVRQYEASTVDSMMSSARVLSILTQAVALNDDEAAVELAHRQQVTQTGPALAFDSYLTAARLGNRKALTQLESLGDEVNATQQLALSELYGTFFQDAIKAKYWQKKAQESAGIAFSLSPD